MLSAARITVSFQRVCTFLPRSASLAVCQDKDSACVLLQTKFQIQKQPLLACGPPAQPKMMRLAAFNYRWMVPELLYQ